MTVMSVCFLWAYGTWRQNVDLFVKRAHPVASGDAWAFWKKKAHSRFFFLVFCFAFFFLSTLSQFSRGSKEGGLMPSHDRLCFRTVGTSFQLTPLSLSCSFIVLIQIGAAKFAAMLISLQTWTARIASRMKMAPPPPRPTSPAHQHQQFRVTEDTPVDYLEGCMEVLVVFPNEKSIPMSIQRRSVAFSYFYITLPIIRSYIIDERFRLNAWQSTYYPDVTQPKVPIGIGEARD